MVVGSTIEVTVLVVLRTCVSVGTITNVAKSTSSASTNVLGHTLKLVITLLATGQSTALVLKFIHGHCWQGSCLVVSRLVVVHLVDRHSGVDNVGLDHLLLDNRLNGLMNVLRHVSKDHEVRLWRRLT